MNSLLGNLKNKGLKKRAKPRSSPMTPALFMLTLEEFLNSLPKPGEKVKFIKAPEFHFFQDVIQNHHDFLKEGEIYEVETCSPASSWSPLTLKGYGRDVLFSWHSFEKIS